MAPSDKPVCLIIGGSRGIGRQVAVDLARNGYHSKSSTARASQLPASRNTTSNILAQSSSPPKPPRMPLRFPHRHSHQTLTRRNPPSTPSSARSQRPAAPRSPCPLTCATRTMSRTSSTRSSAASAGSTCWSTTPAPSGGRPSRPRRSSASSCSNRSIQRACTPLCQRPYRILAARAGRVASSWSHRRFTRGFSGGKLPTRWGRWP
jgi:hypothetical protein